MQHLRFNLLFEHYENMSMQYSDIRDVKLIFFFYIFKISDQNLACWYMFEPPRQVVLTSTHNLCFGAKKIRKVGITPKYPSFLYKSEVYRSIHCMDMFS